MQTRPAPERMAVTLNEAASILGIGRSLAYSLARSGELPTCRVGRRRRVAIKTLEKLLEAEPADRETAAAR